MAQVSLPDAVRLATELDPNITALRQQVASKTIGVQEERDAYYPSLSVAADSGTTDSSGPGITLTVSQVLYDWGLIRSKIQVASQARVQSVSELKMAVEGLTLQVAETFLDVEIAERKIRLTQDYMTYAGRLAEQSEARGRAGLGDNGEVARARLEIARARDQLSRLQSDRDMSLMQIEFLTGRPVSSVGRPPEIGFAQHYSKGDRILAAVRIAPDYISARSMADEAAAKVDTARASRLPTIKLQAQGRKDLNGGRSRTAIGLSAGVDLNAGSFGGRGIQVAQQDLKAAQSSVRAVERQLSNVAQTALQHLQTLRANETSREAQLVQARRVLDNYEEQFTAGKRELIDVLTTGRDLYDAQIDQVDTYDERKRTEYIAAHDLGVLGTLILPFARTQ
ncbi:TolC family protein [Oceaniglobus trochenteri]|uniref:TolC family protein n=1 Tax=Oceaniglobus trochenteri TaxID=2763260 RepID=UPI001D000FE2|nr:TolC family protein [Oceaniglobus trochenteri]